MRPRVLVTGDLNVDLVCRNVAIGGITRMPRIDRVLGGAAYNAARAFATTPIRPIVVAQVGADSDGDRLIASLEEQGIEQLIARVPDKPTCTCYIVYHSGTEGRTIFYTGANANDYDASWLRSVSPRVGLTSSDFVFAPLHVYDQTDGNIERCRLFFRALRDTGARLIVDLVPHRIYESLDLETLVDILGGPAFWVIGELHTFLQLIDRGRETPPAPSRDDCRAIARAFRAEHVSCRYGLGNISRDLVFTCADGEIAWPGSERRTGYESLADADKRAFGDRLTANTLVEFLSSELGEGASSHARRHA